MTPTCIGCGCDDNHACDFGCSWLVVDRRVGLGVCSECHGHWPRFLELRKARWFVPLHYKISTPLTAGRWVDGFAVRLPAPFSRLRFCVRHEGTDWRVDHYDSGMGVIGPTMTVGERRQNVILHVKRWQRRGRTRGGAVVWLMEYLAYLRRTGKLQRVMHLNGFGWCLREAGL